MDTSFRLRPMDLRDILDDTFDLYKENFALFVTIAAIVFLPFNLVLFLVTGGARTAPTPGGSPTVAMQYIGTQIGVVLFATIAGNIAMAALTRAISERYLGRRATLKEAYSSILERVGAFLLTLFLPYIVFSVASTVALGAGVAISAGLWFVHPVLGVIAGILLFIGVFIAIFLLWYGITFVIPVFIVENRTAWDAVRRSFQLFYFSPGKVFGTLFLVMFIVSIITGVILLPFFGLLGYLSFSGGEMNHLVYALQGALNGVAQSIFQPLQSIVILLLYYDIRIRREGFDLEMMANDLRSTVSLPDGSPYSPEEPPASLE